jgi:hypothetical protein
MTPSASRSNLTESSVFMTPSNTTQSRVTTEASMFLTPSNTTQNPNVTIDATHRDSLNSTVVIKSDSSSSEAPATTMIGFSANPSPEEERDSPRAPSPKLDAVPKNLSSDLADAAPSAADTAPSAAGPPLVNPNMELARSQSFSSEDINDSFRSFSSEDDDDINSEFFEIENATGL